MEIRELGHQTENYADNYNIFDLNTHIIGSGMDRCTNIPAHTGKRHKTNLNRVYDIKIGYRYRGIRTGIPTKRFNPSIYCFNNQCWILIIVRKLEVKLEVFFLIHLV